MNPLTYQKSVRWTFATLQGGARKTGKLALYWEVNGDSISDEYDCTETPADELLDIWLDCIWQNKAFHPDFGEPHVAIHWFVHGADSGTFEYAPPIVRGDQRENFLWSPRVRWPRSSTLRTASRAGQLPPPARPTARRTPPRGWRSASRRGSSWQAGAAGEGAAWS